MDKAFEKYAYSVIKQYVPKLLLQRHTWKLKYGLNNQTALMECVFNYPYLNVELTYGDKVVERWKSGEEVLTILVHEMCHPITDPLYSKALDRCVSKNEIEDERELLTDHICNIVLNK